MAKYNWKQKQNKNKNKGYVVHDGMRGVSVSTVIFDELPLDFSTIPIINMGEPLVNGNTVNRDAIVTWTSSDSMGINTAVFRHGE